MKRNKRHASLVIAIAALTAIPGGCSGKQTPVQSAEPEAEVAGAAVPAPPPIPGPSGGAEDSPRIEGRDDGGGVYMPPDPWSGGLPPPWLGISPPPPPPGPPPVAVAPPYPTTGLGPVTAPSTGMSVKWKKKIGYTTYRSTIHYFDGKIVVNSNGEQYKATSGDSLDGLWVLDPKDGSEILHFVPPGTGEKDVNGVAVTKDALVFGTDQDLLFWIDWSGKVKWKTQIAGDVEAAPALSDLDGDTVLDVAAGGEGGTFYAVSGKKGKVLHTTQATQGYYGATGFVGAPALFDATGDGVDDVFVPCRDEVFRCIDGKSGGTVWTKQCSSGMHGAPVIVDADGDGAKEVIFSEAYSEVYAADAVSGMIVWHVELSNPGGGIEGLFGPLAWYPDAGCVLVATAWWGNMEGVYCLDGKTGATRWRYEESQKNITSGSVIGDVDGQGGAEAVFGTESGRIVAVSSTGMPVRQLELGGPIECTPTLADIDGDGLIEILAASNDQYLWVIDTEGKAPPVIGYHRGPSTNTGVL